MTHQSMSLEQLENLHTQLLDEFYAVKAQHLSLDIARGKPSKEQLDLSNDMLGLPDINHLHLDSGEDIRNYGGDPQGIPELRAIFSPILGVPTTQIIAGGNSSLAMMHDCVVWALLKALPDATIPWVKADDVTFLCPAPGYELHHRICEDFNIKLQPVPVTKEGLDMDVVEELVKNPSVKAIWCVPTYANPTGEVYSDRIVKRLASMKTAAPDFRIFWDNAYIVHHLTEKENQSRDILAESAAAGHANRPLVFTSTSKITFAGSGVSFLAASPDNIAWYVARSRCRSPGIDKVNQFRHALFLKDAKHLKQHMEKHRAILAPKFQIVIQAFKKRLGRVSFAQWSEPEGGYFINVQTYHGTAKRAVSLAKEAGVNLTVAGSTWPYGQDPYDSNIRIAPSLASMDDLTLASDVIALSILLAEIEYRLKNKITD